MSPSAHPELDESDLLNSELASQYRSLLGSINWVVTLGRFDLAYSLQALSRFTCAPRQGHYDMALRVMSYLKKFPDGRLLCDTSKPDYSDIDQTVNQNWTDFYPDAVEYIPPHVPTALGKSIRLTCYKDSDHAHDQLTRRSVSGILMLANNMPIRAISKRQATVETSTYGAEMVAARIAVDLIIELRYTLRMMGIPIDGPAMLFGDNKSVVLNTTVPSSVLKKKHCACNYHRIREAIASGTVVFQHLASSSNPADILTKPVDNDTFHRHTKKYLFRAPKTSNPDVTN